MRTFFRLFGVAIFVSLVQVVLLMTGAYDALPWFDIPMHFAGGVAMAVLALAAEQLIVSKSKRTTSIPFIIRFVSIVGFVAIIGIAWEWFEWGLDHYVLIVRNAIGMSQPSVDDTMFDLFMDLSGGTLTFLISHLFKNRK
jgi:hypothetical protein